MRSKFVRARHEDGDMVRDDLHNLFNDLARLLNGDHRKPRIEHYCHLPGCCGGQQRSVAIRDITALLVEAYFSKIGVELPAIEQVVDLWTAPGAPSWLLAGSSCFASRCIRCLHLRGC